MPGSVTTCLTMTGMRCPASGKWCLAVCGRLRRLHPSLPQHNSYFPLPLSRMIPASSRDITASAISFLLGVRASVIRYVAARLRVVRGEGRVAHGVLLTCASKVRRETGRPACSSHPPVHVSVEASRRSRASEENVSGPPGTASRQGKAWCPNHPVDLIGGAHI